jgi:hypothetical protein
MNKVSIIVKINVKQIIFKKYFIYKELFVYHVMHF